MAKVSLFLFIGVIAMSGVNGRSLSNLDNISIKEKCLQSILNEKGTHCAAMLKEVGFMDEDGEFNENIMEEAVERIYEYEEVPEIVRDHKRCISKVENAETEDDRASKFFACILIKQLARVMGKLGAY